MAHGWETAQWEELAAVGRVGLPRGSQGTGVVETGTGDRPDPALLGWGMGSGDLFLGLNSHVCRFSTLLPRKASHTCFPKSMLLSQRDITFR